MSRTTTDDNSRATRELTGGLVKQLRNGYVCELSLSNPPLNLVTKQLLDGLYETLVQISADEEIRCLIVHQGAARAFCAGSDMREFEHISAKAVDRKILFEEFVTRRLAKLNCPTIAVIDGAAVGGGFELALACDLRIASESSKVGLTESTIGGLGGSGAVRIARLVGPSRAAELLFTGRVLTATEAFNWGLINEVSSAVPVLERARELATLICSRGPLSNTFAKQLIAASLDGSSAEALSLANELQERIFQSSDLYRGAKAYFDKTTVTFEGA